MSFTTRPELRGTFGMIKGRFGPEVAAELERPGHVVEPQGPWTLGRLSAPGRLADGTLRAAANARGMQGYAVGR
jgi:gamma-glutamyltranspeptidase / glutathione hydrolase